MTVQTKYVDIDLTEDENDDVKVFMSLRHTHDGDIDCNYHMIGLSLTEEECRNLSRALNQMANVKKIRRLSSLEVV